MLPFLNYLFTVIQFIKESQDKRLILNPVYNITNCFSVKSESKQPFGLLNIKYSLT